MKKKTEDPSQSETENKDQTQTGETTNTDQTETSETTPNEETNNENPNTNENTVVEKASNDLLLVNNTTNEAPLLLTNNDEGTEVADVTYVAKIGDTEYETLEKAIEAANDGDTINLYEGTFTTYNKVKTTKSLTFVGAGSDKTTWEIGYGNPINTGEDGDYTFDGAPNITFKNLTLQCSAEEKYRGFVRIQNVVLENCIFKGFALYWGTNSTTFNNVTFKDTGKYHLWVYTGNTFNFTGCTFENTSGNFIKVYSEAGNATAKVVNINNCIFNSSKVDKAAVNINDATLQSGTYSINFTGSNKFKGVSTTKPGNNQYFSYSNDGENGYKSNVTIDGKLVWENGAATSNPIPTDSGNPTASLPDDQQKIEYNPNTEEDKQIKFEDENFAPSSDTSLDLNLNVDIKGSIDEENNQTVGNVEESVKETTETAIKEKLEEGIPSVSGTTVSSDTHEVSSYTYLDITLNASYTKDGQTESSNITELPKSQARTIEVLLDDSTFYSVSNSDLVKVLRIHNTQNDLLDATLNGRKLTFTTNLFSTYVIVSFNTKPEEPKPDPEPSDPEEPSTPDTPSDSGNNKSDSSSSSNTNTYVECDYTKNLIWSDSLGKCVYRVVRTSTHK